MVDICVDLSFIYTHSAHWTSVIIIIIYFFVIFTLASVKIKETLRSLLLPRFYDLNSLKVICELFLILQCRLV